MITYAEAIISLFNEYQNKTISEDELFAKVTPYSSVLDRLFFESNDLPLCVFPKYFRIPTMNRMSFFFKNLFQIDHRGFNFFMS